MAGVPPPANRLRNADGERCTHYPDDDDESDDAQFGERLQVERMGVDHGERQLAVLGPVVLVRAGADAHSWIRGIRVDGDLPELIAAVAADAVETLDTRCVGTGRALEIRPSVGQ